MDNNKMKRATIILTSKMQVKKMMLVLQAKRKQFKKQKCTCELEEGLDKQHKEMKGKLKIIAQKKKLGLIRSRIELVKVMFQLIKVAAIKMQQQDIIG